MQEHRFDALARRAATGATRRGVALGLVAGLAALTLGRGEAAAKSSNQAGNCRRRGKHAAIVCHKGTPKCIRRRNVDAHLQHGDRLGGCATGPGSETCAATNGCGDPRCGVNNDCFCRINAETLGIFCGGSAFDALSCDECTGDTVCVDLAGCGGGVGCAVACG